MLLAIFATCYSQPSPTKPQNQAQEPPKTPQDRPQKPQESQRWPQNGPQNVWQSLSKSGGHMLGSPFLAILGPPGPSWAHLGPLSLPSCHPTSPLGTSKAGLRPPKLHLLRSDSASCKLCPALDLPRILYIKGLCKVCHLPASQHFNLNVTLQSPRTMVFMFMSKHVYQ